MNDKPTGVERFFEEAAYVAALMIHLIENKSDHEADAEIAALIEQKPFMVEIVFGVLKSYATPKQ